MWPAAYAKTLGAFLRGKMEYFIQLIDSLAWPVAVLIIVLIFKKELSKLISKLSNVKYREFEANFSNKLQDAEDKLKEIKRPDVKDIPEALEQSKIEETDYDRIMRIAEISPRAAISEAWSEVEIAAKTAARQSELHVDKPESVRNIVKAFIKNGVFNEMNLQAFEELRVLRNRAVHTPEFYIQEDETEKYIDLALRLAFELYNVGNILEWAKSSNNQ